MNKRNKILLSGCLGLILCSSPVVISPSHARSLWHALGFGGRAQVPGLHLVARDNGKGKNKNAKANQSISATLQSTTVTWQNNLRTKISQCNVSFQVALKMATSSNVLATSSALKISHITSPTGQAMRLPRRRIQRQNVYYNKVYRYNSQKTVSFNASGSIMGLKDMPKAFQTVSATLAMITATQTKTVKISKIKAFKKPIAVTPTASVTILENNLANKRYNVKFNWMVKAPKLSPRITIWGLDLVVKPVLVDQNNKIYTVNSASSSSKGLRQGTVTSTQSYSFRVGPDFKFKEFRFQFHTQIQQEEISIELKHIPLYTGKSGPQHL